MRTEAFYRGWRARNVEEARRREREKKKRQRERRFYSAGLDSEGRPARSPLTLFQRRKKAAQEIAAVRARLGIPRLHA